MHRIYQVAQVGLIFHSKANFRALRHQPGENLDRQEGRILGMGQSGQEVVPFGSWKTRGQLRIRRP